MIKLTAQTLYNVIDIQRLTQKSKICLKKSLNNMVQNKIYFCNDGKNNLFWE